MHSELLATARTVLTDANKLFPPLIEVGMPAGVSGLVIAGLLAAAMSSRSSCSIITVDFVDRLGLSRVVSDRQHVQLARLISVLIGAIVIGLASVLGMVYGNLLEVTYKEVNLLTAPLFGLFFMALFVPWATGPGTIASAVAGVTAAATINFWKELTGEPGRGLLRAMPRCRSWRRWPSGQR